MQWLNEPAIWQRAADVITVSVEPGTDFWRETGHGYIRDHPVEMWLRNGRAFAVMEGIAIV